jgi:hypothetical protein
MAMMRVEQRARNASCSGRSISAADRVTLCECERVCLCVCVCARARVRVDAH